LSWLPAAFNEGWAYRDRIRAPALASAYFAARYPHSDQQTWRQRLAAGEIWRNGQQLRADGTLAAGDRLVWHRPPWQEASVPVLPGPLFDDGDLVVFNKPSGLPVLPAGGFLRHTVLGQLQALVAGSPRPVHRLGRFTSGLLVCARSASARAWLSAQLRQCTACKLYRALLNLPLPGSPLQALARDHGPAVVVETPIGRRPHPALGTIWCAADPADPQALPSHSCFRLVEQRPAAWLVEVAIATGRPHQIRIHAAAAGAPLLGDPLYWPGGQAGPEALPGDGGYCLHAHRLQLSRPDGSQLELEAPLPPVLQGSR
jgi:23S rRNA pseudouridine1911/1915/1917 synthase